MRSNKLTNIQVFFWFLCCYQIYKLYWFRFILHAVTDLFYFAAGEANYLNARTVDFNRPWGTDGPERLRHIWTGRLQGLKKRLCRVPWNIHRGWWFRINTWPFWSNPDKSSVCKYKEKLDTETREHGLASVHGWQKLYYCKQETQSFL